jgi:hypothetical protein
MKDSIIFIKYKNIWRILIKSVVCNKQYNAITIKDNLTDDTHLLNRTIHNWLNNEHTSDYYKCNNAEDADIFINK